MTKRTYHIPRDGRAKGEYLAYVVRAHDLTFDGPARAIEVDPTRGRVVIDGRIAGLTPVDDGADTDGSAA